MKTETLIKMLEKSAQKHGADTALTIGHLLGILKFAKEIDDNISDKEEKRMQRVDQEWFESTL